MTAFEIVMIIIGASSFLLGLIRLMIQIAYIISEKK